MNDPQFAAEFFWDRPVDQIVQADEPARPFHGSECLFRVTVLELVNIGTGQQYDQRLVRMPFRVPCDEGPSGFVSEGDEFVSGVVPTFRESPLRETDALSRILPTKGRPPGRSGEEKQR